MLDLFYKIKLIFFKTTYWISNSDPIRVIKGAASFLQYVLIISGFPKKSKYLIVTLTQDKTTPELA